MPQVKIYRSSSKTLRLLAISSPLLIIGLYSLNARASHIPAKAGWACIFIFGIVALYFLYILLDRRPQFVISENGILNKGTSAEFISWSIVKDVYLKDVSGQKFICLAISDENMELIRGHIKPEKIYSGKAGYQNIRFPLSKVRVDERHFMDFLITMTKMDNAGRAAALVKLTPESFT